MTAGAAAAQAGAPARPALPLRARLRRFWNITYALAITEFKVRYFESVLGYLWSLLRPLMLFGVLYVVFTHVVRFGEGITHYPLKLLLALVLWSYFQEATGDAVESLVNRENLLRKIAFPRAAIPLSVALTSAFNFGLNLLVVLLFIVATGIAPDVAWLELVPLAALLLVLTVAIGMLLSILYVSFRDMSPIWEVALSVLFWGSPIIYVIQTAPESVRQEMSLNPLAMIITQARYALIDHQGGSAAHAAGGAEWLLVPLGIVAALLAFSIYLYRRMAPRIAERL